MRITKTEVVPQSQREVLVKMLCDICRGEIVNYHYSAIKSKEHKNGFLGKFTNVANVKIEYEEGLSCSDGGTIIELKWDICPDCMMLKVTPFLKSLGAEPSIKETNF